MSLYSEWQAVCAQERDEKAYKEFWKTYFDAEKENYKRILSDHTHVFDDKLSVLADGFNMNHIVFVGFLDGINTSLKKELSLERLKDGTQIKLEIDFEKLYFNMLEAKASWLFKLSEWDDVLSEEKRKEITQEWRTSKRAVSHKVGRNDPCPCGSGKKYKKCCGATE